MKSVTSFVVFIFPQSPSIQTIMSLISLYWFIILSLFSHNFCKSMLWSRTQENCYSIKLFNFTTIVWFSAQKDALTDQETAGLYPKVTKTPTKSSLSHFQSYNKLTDCWLLLTMMVIWCFFNINSQRFRLYSLMFCFTMYSCTVLYCFICQASGREPKLEV